MLLHSNNNGASRHPGSMVRPHLTSMADRLLKGSMVLHRRSSSGVSNLPQDNMPLPQVPRRANTAHHHRVSMAHRPSKDSMERRHRDSTERHRRNNHTVRRRGSTNLLHLSNSTALRRSRLSDMDLSRQLTSTSQGMSRLSARP